MEQILKVENINVYYGAIHAIKGVSFHVDEGEIVTLIGANGAGKSTTLQTISGLLRSRTGSIEFCGENISKLPPHKICLLYTSLQQRPEPHLLLHRPLHHGAGAQGRHPPRYPDSHRTYLQRARLVPHHRHTLISQKE